MKQRIPQPSRTLSLSLGLPAFGGASVSSQLSELSKHVLYSHINSIDGGFLNSYSMVGYLIPS